MWRTASPAETASPLPSTSGLLATAAGAMLVSEVGKQAARDYGMMNPPSDGSCRCIRGSPDIRMWD